jgi:hypothetical protein
LQTLDGQAAAINVGQDFPIVGSVVITGTGVATTSIDRRTVGVILRVTPRISPDGRVLMRVFPEVSSVIEPPIQLGNGQQSNALAIQQVDTTVSVYDGETVAIGGLISKKNTRTENKVPLLGDLPWVGAAFRYRTQTQAKTELLLILTPRVIRTPLDAQRVLYEERQRIDWCTKDVANVHGPMPAVADPLAPRPGSAVTNFLPPGSPGAADCGPDLAPPRLFGPGNAPPPYTTAPNGTVAVPAALGSIPSMAVPTPPGMIPGTVPLPPTAGGPTGPPPYCPPGGYAPAGPAIPPGPTYGPPTAQQPTVSYGGPGFPGDTMAVGSSVYPVNDPSGTAAGTQAGKESRGWRIFRRN